ncbi:hypothetical protein [Neptunicella sp. SCSIO 80796]|uniref:hypothetical protein n=1 Tax=Neptunicella plasticusilytica TaxID=3117012 RepID=UPI003A4E36C4
MTDSNKSETPNHSVNHRRTFLKKASTVSLIAALPVKSVWGNWNGGGGANGCTVSGNMSGNASQQAPCTVQGKSPGYWHTYCDSNKRSRSYGGYVADNEAWKNVFGWSRSPFGGISRNTGLHDFLPEQGGNSHNGGPDNINRHLTAAYYNAVNGFYPLQSGVSPESYVQQLYDEANRSGTYQVAQAIQGTYN